MRTVADAMTKPVIVERSTTIQHASATMLDRRSEAAIVVAGGKLWGLVSAADVARGLAQGLDPKETPVGAIAGTDPPRARSDEALADVHQRMRAAQHPLAVVIGPDGRPLGLLVDHEAAPWM
jgi:CBS domain-containing protein